MDRSRDINVLLVDDDPVSLGIGRTWLMDLGFAVIAVRSAECAELLLKVCGFDLLVSNVSFRAESTGGFALAAMATDRRPASRALFVSTDDQPTAQAGARDVSFLKKGFGRDQLQNALHCALSATA
jgi:DNA-binding NtrC family response regulator